MGREGGMEKKSGSSDCVSIQQTRGKERQTGSVMLTGSATFKCVCVFTHNKKRCLTFSQKSEDELVDMSHYCSEQQTK